MKKEEVYEAWAPAASPWSPWTKPVLFAQMSQGTLENPHALTALQVPPPAAPIEPPNPFAPPDLMQPAPIPAPTPPLATTPGPDWRVMDVSWAPPGSDTAIVLDLPGRASLLFGMALAAKGFRPIPLYNACSGPDAAIDLEPIVGGLVLGAHDLLGMSFLAEAPPVFLLDANRLTPLRPLKPGRLDNRWVVFPQDFPSANFLLSKGVRNVLLVQDGAVAPKNDLSHVLMRWQEAGIAHLAKDLLVSGAPSPLQVTKPSAFRALMHRLSVAAGLRRNSAGGFGSVIPMPSQSSGGSYGGGYRGGFS